MDDTGSATHLAAGKFSIEPVGKWTNPESGNTYPMGWILRIPSRDPRLELVPVTLDQELHGLTFTPVDYWEGEVEVRGTVKGVEVRCFGYVELISRAHPDPAS